jgi:CubicO group peptidase (beta-lactamase class C family)
LHVKTEDGFRLGTPAEDELYYAPDSQLFLGGEGLVSTMNDFGRFCQMLVDQGRAPDGLEVLSKKTLDFMLMDQLQDVPGYGSADKGYVLGFGFQILKEKRGNEVASVGSFGWSGYHTTHFWIDPKEKQYGLFMTRLYPFNGDILSKLQQVIYSSQ